MGANRGSDRCLDRLGLTGALLGSFVKLGRKTRTAPIRANDGVMVMMPREEAAFSAPRGFAVDRAKSPITICRQSLQTPFATLKLISYVSVL